jgi:hypothetical protein
MVVRTAKCAPTIFAIFLAITTVPSIAKAAADHCLTEPGNKAPQGQHWRYRFEHGTKRHCWFLQKESERSAPARTESSANAAAPSRVNPAAAPRSVADAHDELPSPPVRGEQDGGGHAARRAGADVPTEANLEANQNPDASASPSVSVPADSESLFASRWPERLAVNSSVNPTPEASATMVADASLTPQAEPSPALAPVTLAEAPVPAQNLAGPLQMMWLVILGGLALASLTGSAVFYGLGRAWNGGDIRVSLTDSELERIEEFLARLSKRSQIDMKSLPSR